MKRALILQHLTSDGPGVLGTFLREAGVPFDVFNTQLGEAFPDAIDGYAGLAVLGGEMSANDPLPSLRRAERLIVQAVDRDVPVLGHCLGGQLMARALGVAVAASPAPEVGWHDIDLLDGDDARAWFGDARSLRVFQWHNEAFALPCGARPLATNGNCEHQAFAIGPHLAMQFHIELDAEKLERWSAETKPEYLEAQRIWPTVHSGERMRRDAAAALPDQIRAAERIYRRWLGFVMG